MTWREQMRCGLCGQRLPDDRPLYEHKQWCPAFSDDDDDDDDLEPQEEGEER
jgi:hypothetical protein